MALTVDITDRMIYNILGQAREGVELGSERLEGWTGDIRIARELTLPPTFCVPPLFHKEDTRKGKAEYGIYF